MLFIGFHTTFLVQHLLGMEGMARRYADYLPEEGFQLLNDISSAGALLLGLSMIPFMWNVWKTWHTAPLVRTDDPWGYGASLEWATSCPPPRHNFTSLPRIRSERPAFDLHHPETAPGAWHAPSHTGVSSVMGPADLGEAPPEQHR
jgi:cytochrome c oxidase subunit 1